MMRRFVVLLPSQFNDGADVAEMCMDCFPETLMAVVDRFGGSFERTPIEGWWIVMGGRYDDELLQLTVDVPDIDDSRR